MRSKNKINSYSLILVQSYLNEIDNDLASISLTSGIYNKLFLFKNYKINNFSNFKKSSFIFIAFLFAFTPLLLLFNISYIFLFFLKLFSPVKSGFKKICLVTGASSEYNFSLISLNIENCLFLRYKLFDLLSAISYLDLLKAAITSIHYSFSVVLNLNGFESLKSRSIRVHSIDFIKLTLYQRVVINCQKQRLDIYLDSHYERWNYIASKMAPTYHCIVQHGFARDDISFSHKFGAIKELYIYNSCFLEYFNTYYSQVFSHHFIKSRILLSPVNKNASLSLLLASSPISIDIELKFLSFINTFTEFDVFVKLHPLHDYKHRFQEFDFVFFTSDFLDADVLVTFNSFLGYEYQSIGKNVIWLNSGIFYEDQIKDILQNKCRT